MNIRDVKGIKYFTKGKRGMLYLGRLGKKRVVIKKKRPESKAVGRIENEARWLRVLNKEGIGPKLLFSGRGYFCYEYVDGEFLPEFIAGAGRKKIAEVIEDVLRQCFVMDRIKVDKEEMHRPYKHIIVSRENKKVKAVLVDFERCHVVAVGKNVTQFCQYIMGGLKYLLAEKGFKIGNKRIIECAKKYKNNMNIINLKKIINEIK